MANVYYTVNDKGRAEIVEFLNRYHKRPAAQIINGWVEIAEENMANNGPDHTTIELRPFDARSGHVESLTLEGNALDEVEFEL
jgi:DNA-binding PadR family transcriptional regulator